MNCKRCGQEISKYDNESNFFTCEYCNAEYNPYELLSNRFYIDHCTRKVFESSLAREIKCLSEILGKLRDNPMLTCFDFSSIDNPPISVVDLKDAQDYPLMKISGMNYGGRIGALIEKIRELD